MTPTERREVKRIRRWLAKQIDLCSGKADNDIMKLRILEQQYRETMLGETKKRVPPFIAIGYECMDDVMSGRKRIAIMEGHQAYTIGPAYVGCRVWARKIEIICVRWVWLRDVTAEELRANGFNSQDEALEALRQLYPDITLDSKVTVVKWVAGSED